MDLNHTLRSLVLGLPRMRHGRPGERAGEARLAQHRIDLSGVAPLVVMSPAFVKGGVIPARYTVEGVGLSPPLRWGGAPPGTRSWAVWMEDPDAPTPEPFIHWLVTDLDTRRGSLPEGVPPQGVDMAMQGLNSFLGVGYTPCAPPRGDIPHRYHFQVFALDRYLDLDPGFGRQEILRVIRGRVLAFGETVGLYGRPE